MPKGSRLQKTDKRCVSEKRYSFSRKGPPAPKNMRKQKYGGRVFSNTLPPFSFQRGFSKRRFDNRFYPATLFLRLLSRLFGTFLAAPAPAGKQCPLLRTLFVTRFSFFQEWFKRETLAFSDKMCYTILRKKIGSREGFALLLREPIKRTGHEKQKTVYLH